MQKWWYVALSLLIASGFVVSPPAHAEDVAIHGNRIYLKQHETLGASVYFKSIGRRAASVLLDPGAPTREGVTITVFDTADIENRATYKIPGGRYRGGKGWRVDRSDRAWYRNRFARNGQGTQVSQSIFDANHRASFRARGLGDTDTFDLTARPKGKIGVQVEMGSVTTCAQFEIFKYRKSRNRAKLVGRRSLDPASIDCPFDLDPVDPPDPENPPLPDLFFDFAPAVNSSGSCGSARDGDGRLLRNLECGLLYIGGGGSILAPSGTPDGLPNRFGLECTGPDCTITPVGTLSDEFECTKKDCPFGMPVPIPASGASTCVFNTFAEDASGTLNLETGAANINVPLSSHVFLTGIHEQPCPVCTASGTPENPGVGVCDSGENEGEPCTSANSQGLTRQCPPSRDEDLGTLPVNLSPLSTSVVSQSSVDGRFCEGQGFGGAGCFTRNTCREITKIGQAGGPLTEGVPADVVLASTFCVPVTAAPLINFSANLPGPGATSIVGTIKVGRPEDPENPPIEGPYVDFAPLLSPTSVCGAMRDTNGNKIRDLECGLLYIGGGGAILAPSVTPDGAPNRFGLDCDGPNCNITPISNQSEDFECSDVGCNFGTPVPLPAAGASTCVFNTLAEPASGTLNLETGEASFNISLTSQVFLTGNQDSPCSVCSASGSPDNPGIGVCTSGQNEGSACRSVNSIGLSQDCLPDAEHNLGTLPVNLTPLTTSTVSKAEDRGFFCPGQGFGNAGGLGRIQTRQFDETGSPAGPLVDDVATPVTLASTFCVPVTAAPLINFSANLPGPGATSLVGTLKVHGTRPSTP